MSYEFLWGDVHQALGRSSDDIRGAIPGLTHGGPTGYALPIAWIGLSIIAENIARGGCVAKSHDRSGYLQFSKQTRICKSFRSTSGSSGLQQVIRTPPETPFFASELPLFPRQLVQVSRLSSSRMPRHLEHFLSRFQPRCLFGSREMGSAVNSFWMSAFGPARHVDRVRTSQRKCVGGPVDPVTPPAFLDSPTTRSPVRPVAPSGGGSMERRGFVGGANRRPGPR